MERFTSFEVQAFVTYLLKLRRWCVRMLTEVTKETHLHFPIQAAVEGMIGWGKCKSTILLLLITGLNLVLYNFSNSTHSVCANDILRHGEWARSFSSETGRPSKYGYGPTGSSDAELYRSRQPREWKIFRNLNDRSAKLALQSSVDGSCLLILVSVQFLDNIYLSNFYKLISAHVFGIEHFF